ncbi:MAG: hypothetical protein V3W41_14175 [Planctomycetota bacterium]
MKFGILHVFGLAALCLGVYLVWGWFQGPPFPSELTWSEGTVTSREVHHNQNTRSIRLTISGQTNAFTHSRDMPGNKTLSETIPEGLPVRLLYDPEQDARFKRTYGLEAHGTTVIALDEMLDWDRNNRLVGLVVGVMLLVIMGLA